MLYNKYRPRKFEDVVGNETTVKDLQKRAASSSLPHVMMFVGDTGTGKTTLANIVASTINCSSPIETDNGVEPCGECSSCLDIASDRFSRDVRFFDGSDLGKDTVESIRDIVRFQPMNDEANVVIIDEAQNITSAGMERTLKLLEFERDDVYFILCTMNPKAFNTAIRSRGQVYQFNKLSKSLIAERLFDIAEQEIEAGVVEDISDKEEEILFVEGLLTISEYAEGSMRQAISYLERCLNSGLYTRDQIEKELGVVSEAKTFAVLQKLLKYDPDFFMEIRELDLKAFFNYSWKVVNETAIRSFNLDNEDPDDWKVKNSRKLLNLKGFWPLLSLFIEANASQSNWFNERNFMSHLIKFFHESKPEASKPPKVERTVAPKDKEPVRRRRVKAS